MGRQRYDMACLQQTQGFQELNHQARNLIIGLSQGETNFEELRTVLRNENKQTRDHIDKATQQQQAQQKKEWYRQQFLDSLWFNEIHSREERIADAHRETFEWIFDKSGQAVSPWDNFVQWLESGRNAYWINGKAGSGKSTLMSFLCQDARTKDSLRLWSGYKGFLMPKFFFWSGGTLLEKSIEGLLRSLIWQILNDLPDLDIGFAQPIAAWTERRLRTTLQQILQLALNSHPLCFFIDGLDEFGGEQDELVSFIQQAVQGTDVKVCLSSRPYRVFEKAFESSAKLRLQDLTRKDIQKFLFDKFQGMEQAPGITLQHSLRLEDVTERILERAEGVFLWVSLAVRDQLHGFRNGDSPAQLEERLENLPNEVEGIYAHMLSQIEKCYRGEASQLLQVALHGTKDSGDRTLLGFALAFQGRLDAILRSSDSLPELELITISQSIRERIGITCAGLLEIHDDRRDGPSDRFDGPSHRFNDDELTLDAGGEVTNDQILHLESHVTVNFVHRTAIDFLRDPSQGGAFLKAHIPENFDPQVSYVKVSLAKLRLFGVQCSGYVDDIMGQMWEAENDTGVAQEQLCELIDDVMSKTDSKHPDWRPDSHWCTRWGGLSNLLSWDDQATEVEVSPQSSSKDSLYSIRKELDFLAFAAWNALSRYVLQVLHSQKVPLETGAANCLLFCSECPIGMSLQEVDERYMAGIILTGECLRQGGNPNMVDPFNFSYIPTIWPNFLVKMHKSIRLRVHRYHRPFPTADLTKLRKVFSQTTLAFIENGADVHTLQHIAVNPNRIVPTSFRGKAHEYQIQVQHNYVLDVELSPLAIIELCLNDQHEITQIKDICVAKGAHSYLRFTSIYVQSCVGNDSDDFREFELSGEESAAFIRLFEKNLTSKAAKEHFDHQCIVLGDQIYQDRMKSLS